MELNNYFILYREGRRLCAALAALPKEASELVVAGTRFTPVGRFIHLSHIVDSNRDLIGFSVDGIDQITAEKSWKQWWDTFDNRELEDFWQVDLFLTQERRKDWFPDGAFLVGGGAVFTDQEGEYLLLLPNEQAEASANAKGREFWREIAFELYEPSFIRSV